MNLKRFRIRFFISFFVSSFLFYSSPFINILIFKYSLDHKKIGIVNSMINYPELKTNFKTLLYNRLDRELSENNIMRTNKYFSNLIFDGLLSGLLDLAVSPEGLSNLIESGEIISRDSQKKSLRLSSNNKKKSNQTSLKYIGINDFVISKRFKNNNYSINFLWERKYFLVWKLYSIKLNY